MPRMYHVTSALNRASITDFGLDWNRMGAARGIAGSTSPEEDGIFVCREADTSFFVQLNNTGGPADVWAVEGVEEDELLDNGTGFFYVARRIPPDRLTLVRTDVPPPADPWP